MASSALALPGLVLGVMLAWLLFLVALVFIVAPCVVTLRAFIEVVGPMYEYQPID